MNFVDTNFYGLEKNEFGFIISMITNSRLSIYLEKYIIKHHGEGALQKMSLNFYPGNFEEKLNGFTIFLASLLNEPLLSAVLAGKEWSDDYYKPLWEGTDR